MTKHMPRIKKHWEKKLGPLILWSFGQYYGGYKRQVEGGIRSPASMVTMFLFKKHILLIADVFDSQNKWELVIPFKSILTDGWKQKSNNLEDDVNIGLIQKIKGENYLVIPFYDKNKIFQEPKFKIHWSPFPKAVVGCASIFRGGGLTKFNQKFYDLLLEFKKSGISSKTMEQSKDEKMIYQLLNEDEHKTVEYKTQEFISDSYKIARVFVALANNKFVNEQYGGQIIVGVEDETKKILGVKYSSKHEEHFMNIARDKCMPPIEPIFKKISIESKIVYLISIPKMTKTPYQLKTSKGNIHLIRVGSTIREPTSDELLKLYSN